MPSLSQVYCHTAAATYKRRGGVLVGGVLLARSPSLFPCDLVSATAVDHPLLQQFRHVLIINTKVRWVDRLIDWMTMD